MSVKGQSKREIISSKIGLNFLPLLSHCHRSLRRFPRCLFSFSFFFFLIGLFCTRHDLSWEKEEKKKKKNIEKKIIKKKIKKKKKRQKKKHNFFKLFF